MKRRSKVQPGPQWLDIPSPWIDLPGRLRAACREGEEPSDVRKAVGSGDSGRPYLIENEAVRQLHFVRSKPHSVMRIADPSALVMAYTRKMMAFLLFVPRPSRILLLGLGGGSLAKYCHRHLTGTSLVVVEPDADVVALREAFSLPPDDERLQVVGQRWTEFLAKDVRQYDVVLVDDQDAVELSPPSGAAKFFRGLARCLLPHGCLVMHMKGDVERLEAHTETARSLLDAQIVPVPLSSSGSLLMYGLRQPVLQSAPESMDAAARRLQRALQMDFPDYLYRINENARAENLRADLHKK